jgi:2-succinyl-5-enolpyruvyl-6-hydroxy-3-cyclohexene-1-carboxylate synthase
VNEAIAACFLPVPAPVHLNCHLNEPLYNLVDEEVPLTKIEVVRPQKARLSNELLEELKEELESYSKILLIMGMSSHSEEMESAITCSVEHGAVVLNETTSNVSIPGVMSCIDRSLEALTPEAFSEYKPQLVITFGGPLVSKKIKQKLRDEKPKAHWHIDPHIAHIDMFQCLTRAILCDPAILIQELFSSHKRQDPWFSRTWAALEDSIKVKHKAFMDKAPWSDLKVYSKILPSLPKGAKVQLANSAAVRYAQLFESRSDLSYFSNRGVSGIDGCSSTAVGMAKAEDGPVILLTGDMAFRYDVNAFWIKDLPMGLKCIVVNNGGGGIFRIIPGPARSGHLEFFEAPMENSARKVAELNGLSYHEAKDEASLISGLETLFSDDRTAVLEVFTPQDLNAEVLMDYFKHLKS